MRVLGSDVGDRVWTYEITVSADEYYAMVGGDGEYNGSILAIGVNRRQEWRSPGFESKEAELERAGRAVGTSTKSSDFSGKLKEGSDRKVGPFLLVWQGMPCCLGVRVSNGRWQQREPELAEGQGARRTAGSEGSRMANCGPDEQEPVLARKLPGRGGGTWRPRGADSWADNRPGPRAGSLGLRGSDVGRGGAASERWTGHSSPESDPARPADLDRWRIALEVSNPPPSRERAIIPHG